MCIIRVRAGIVYRNLAGIYLCCVQFTVCYASAGDSMLKIAFNIIVTTSLWCLHTSRLYGTRRALVCGCLHNSRFCVIASLLVIVHCARCIAIRVVFLCGRFVCSVVFLLCCSSGMQGLCWGDGFSATVLKRRGREVLWLVRC